MVGQNNFTTVFAKALLAATPEANLSIRAKSRWSTAVTSSEQIARMERELASLQSQVKSVEETYGVDNLHLTVAKGYVGKLLGNARVVRWLTQHRQEYLTEFQAIAEIEGLMPTLPRGMIDGDPDPISAGTAGDAALWGGSSAAVGMAANPFGAHQAGRAFAGRAIGWDVGRSLGT